MSEKIQYIVLVEGDCNDADYNTTVNFLNDEDGSIEEQLKIISDVSNILSESDINHNLTNIDDIFNTKELKKLWENFTDLINLPGDVGGWAHTIESIQVIEAKKVINYL